MMLNGTDASGGQGALRILAVAEENALFSREDRSVVIEENEVFEEASETPLHLLPDSHADLKSGVENGATAEPGDFTEPIDLQVGDKKHEEQGIVGLKNDASTNAEDIDEKVSASEEKIITCYELNSAHGEGGYLEEPVPTNSADVEGELGDVTSEVSIVEIKTIIKDGGKKTSQKKYVKEELVISSWSDDVPHEGSENGESTGVTSVKYELDSGTESSDWIAYRHGKRSMKDVAVQSVALSEDSAKFPPPEENSTRTLDNGFSLTNGHTSEEKEYVSFSTSEKTTVVKEDGASCSHVSSAASDYIKELKADMHKIAKKLRKDPGKHLSCSKSQVNPDVKSTIPKKLQEEPAKHSSCSRSEIKQDVKSTVPKKLQKEPAKHSSCSRSEIKQDVKSTVPKKLQKEPAKHSSCSRSEIKQDVKSTVPKKLQKEPAKHSSCSRSEIKQDVNSTIPSELPSTSNAARLRGRGSSSRPGSLGSSASLLELSARSFQQPKTNSSAPSRVSRPSIEPTIDDNKENDEIREKLQIIRVKFLRLARRLGQSLHNVVVAQVLYRLGLAEQLKRDTNRQCVFSFDRASVVAEQLEAAGQESLDFSCTIMVIGKTGAGKSATINSILDDVKLPTDAFQLGTKKAQEVVGKVQGIDVRFIDTPGLVSSSSDQDSNEKILRSVKRFINKTPPDIVLYFDRLDMQSRDYGDASLLQTITNTFGASIWFNAIVVLTHAASAPPDGPNGSPLNYEVFINQRSHVVQQAIRQAAGDVRLMNPVSLVENHSACRMNRAGQRILPNGQVWKPQLLLLSFASKILAEANVLLNLQDNPPGKPFGSSPGAPPLPLLLSSLLQSKPQAKLPEEPFGDNENLDDYFDATDSDEDSDYDELPSFKPLTKSQVAKLSKSHKKAYFEELDYREGLHYKKELKEEKRRRKHANITDYHNNEDVGVEASGSASVASAPMPDFVVPKSFDSYSPSHRYRYLDSSNKWLVKPVRDSQIWDHDIGYEGMIVERVDVVKDKALSVSGHLSKNKKGRAVQMEISSLIKHSESKASSLCLDMQNVGKDIAHTIRGEARFLDFRHNNMAAGISVTALGDSMLAGLKFEDKWMTSKILSVLITGGAVVGRDDAVYGGRFEAKLREKEYPIGEALSTFALSIVHWRGELALGCNVQSQFPVVRRTDLIARANFSNKGTGQIAIRLKSSEHLQIALLALVPIVRRAKRKLCGSSQTIRSNFQKNGHRN